MEQGNRPIPNRLEMHRKLMGYTRTRVALLLELHNTAPLCRWESGESMPGALHLLRLGVIYRTYPNELYTEYVDELREDIRQRERKHPNV